MTWIGQYLVAAVVFGVLDALWLGWIGYPLYEERLGDLLADQPNLGAALAFYALYLVGITYFVTRPALAAGSWVSALGGGALLGLVAYATWNLTNLAVLRDFPASLVAIDLLWGTAATATTAVVTHLVCRRVPALGGAPREAVR